jgi:hypothetical protein
VQIGGQSSPVARCVYDRPQHAARTIEALAVNQLARATDFGHRLVLFCHLVIGARQDGQWLSQFVYFLERTHSGTDHGSGASNR